jgi:hypothetical protein
MSVSEFVLEPLNLAGAELRFFAPVKPGAVDLAATVLTWLDMKRQASELLEAAYGSIHIRLSEDAWYEKAQGVFNSHKATLTQSGVSADTFALMLEDYFTDHPNPEIETWVKTLARGTSDGTQTASYH